MKQVRIFYHMLEHAVFYLILACLTVGAAGSLHQKITDRTAVYEVHTEHLLSAQTSSRLPVISMNEWILPEILPECGRYRILPDFR